MCGSADLYLWISVASRKTVVGIHRTKAHVHTQLGLLITWDKNLHH